MYIKYNLPDACKLDDKGLFNIGDSFSCSTEKFKLSSITKSSKLPINKYICLNITNISN